MVVDVKWENSDKRCVVSPPWKVWCSVQGGGEF